MDATLLQNLLEDAFSNIVRYTAAQLQRVAAQASAPCAVVTSSAADNPCHQLLGAGFGARPATGSWGDGQMQLQLQQLQLHDSDFATPGLPHHQQHTAVLTPASAAAAVAAHESLLSKQVSLQQTLAVQVDAAEAAEAAGRSGGRRFAGNSSEQVSEQLLGTQVLEEEQLLEAQPLAAGQDGPSESDSVSNSPPATVHRGRSRGLSFVDRLQAAQTAATVPPPALQDDVEDMRESPVPADELQPAEVQQPGQERSNHQPSSDQPPATSRAELYSTSGTPAAQGDGQHQSADAASIDLEASASRSADSGSQEQQQQSSTSDHSSGSARSGPPTAVAPVSIAAAEHALKQQLAAVSDEAAADDPAAAEAEQDQRAGAEAAEEQVEAEAAAESSEPDAEDDEALGTLVAEQGDTVIGMMRVKYPGVVVYTSTAQQHGNEAATCFWAHFLCRHCCPAALHCGPL
jgi:hypothetical protein